MDWSERFQRLLASAKSRKSTPSRHDRRVFGRLRLVAQRGVRNALANVDGLDTGERSYRRYKWQRTLSGHAEFCVDNRYSITNVHKSKLSTLRSRAYYLDVSKSKCSKLIGRFSGRSSSRASFVYPRPHIFGDFFSSKACPTPYRADTTGDGTLSGGWSCYQQQLQAYVRRKHRVKDDKVAWRNACERLIEKLYLGDCACPNDIDALPIFTTPLRLDSVPGGDWNSVSTKKEFILGSAQQCALDVFNSYCDGVYHHGHVTMVSGRDKRSAGKEVGEDVMSRPLMQEDVVDMLVCGTIAVHVDAVLTRNVKIPISLGFSQNSSDSLNIGAKCLEYPFGIEADTKQNDASVDAEQDIAYAFGVVRSLFGPGEKVDRIFFGIALSFCNKNLVMPDCSIVTLSGATMTGSRVTTIINSMITCLRSERILHEFKPFQGIPSAYDASGDDLSLLFKRLPDFCRRAFDIWTKWKLNCVIKIGNVGRSIDVDPDKSNCFLKLVRYVTPSGRIVQTAQPAAVAKRLSVPEKVFKSPEDVWDFVLGQLNCLVNHPRLWHLLCAFIVHVERNLFGKTADSYWFHFRRTMRMLKGVSELQAASVEAPASGLRFVRGLRPDKVDIWRPNYTPKRSHCDIVNWCYDNFPSDNLPFTPTYQERADWLVRVVGSRSSIMAYGEISYRFGKKRMLRHLPGKDHVDVMRWFREFPCRSLRRPGQSSASFAAFLSRSFKSDPKPFKVVNKYGSPFEYQL